MEGLGRGGGGYATSWWTAGSHRGWSQEGEGRLAAACLGTGGTFDPFSFWRTKIAGIGWEAGGLGERGRIGGILVRSRTRAGCCRRNQLREPESGWALLHHRQVATGEVEDWDQWRILGEEEEDMLQVG